MPSPNPNYEIVPYRSWKGPNGRTASVHGACPWTSEAEKPLWSIVTKGFTIYNINTNQYGMCRPPFATEQEAENFIKKLPVNGTRIGFGD